MTEQEADAYLAMLCASTLLPLLNESEDGLVANEVSGFPGDATE